MSNENYKLAILTISVVPVLISNPLQKRLSELNFAELVPILAWWVRKFSGSIGHSRPNELPAAWNDASELKQASTADQAVGVP